MLIFHIVYIKNNRLFKGCEAHQLMKNGNEIKLADTKWKGVFIKSKSIATVIPGSLFLYYNPLSGI